MPSKVTQKSTVQSNYKPEVNKGSAQIAQKQPLVTAEVKLGSGLGASGKLGIVQIDASAKSYQSYSTYNGKTSGADVGVKAGVTNKLMVAAEGGLTKKDTQGAQKEKTYFVGVAAGDQKYGVSNVKSDKDLKISIGGGLWVGAGAEVSVEVNLSEAYRRGQQAVTKSVNNVAQKATNFVNKLYDPGRWGFR